MKNILAHQLTIFLDYHKIQKKKYILKLATNDIRDNMQLDAYMRGITIAKDCNLNILKHYLINFAD